jgi:hypothetical protein
MIFWKITTQVSWLRLSFLSKSFYDNVMFALLHLYSLSTSKKNNMNEDMRILFLELHPAQKPSDNPRWLVPSEEMLGDRKDNHTSHVRCSEDILRRTKTIRLDRTSASPGAVLIRQGREIRQNVPGFQDSLFTSRLQAFSVMWTLVCSAISKSTEASKMLLLLGWDPPFLCKVWEICRVTSVLYSSSHIRNQKIKSCKSMAAVRWLPSSGWEICHQYGRLFSLFPLPTSTQKRGLAAHAREDW